MSVEFTRPAGTQYVCFDTPPAAALGLTTFSLGFWLLADDVGATSECDLLTIWDGTGTDSDQYVAVFRADGGEKKICFNAHFSTTNGAWYTTSNVINATDTWYHVLVTYDGGATANNPIVYVNGASKAVTRAIAPVGTFRVGTSVGIYAGGVFSNFVPDGKITDIRIYTGILTAAQVLALYNDGVFTPNFDTNLVFHAPLNNCTSLSGSAYDGYTLTSSQLLSDRIGCAVGTPSGSPLGSSTNPS